MWKKGIGRTADPGQTGQAFPCVWRNSGKSPQDVKQLLTVSWPPLLKVMRILRLRQVAWGQGCVHPA